MEYAVGIGSLVLLAGGVSAAARREIRPGQALTVLGIAAAVAAIVALAGWLGGRLGAFYTVAIVLPTALAGIAMAVAVVTRRPGRR
jgi:hypothetical protein